MTDPIEKKRHWPAYLLLGAVIACVMLVLVLPGFVAGFYCRITGDMDTTINLSFFSFGGKPDVKNPSLRIFLAPACLVSEFSPAMARFYMAQYRTTAPKSPVMSGEQ